MPSYIRGEIYFDKLYFYPDSKEPCDKLVLILNKNHTDNQCVVTVPSATNRKDFPLKNGCNKHEKIYYVEKQSGFYNDKSMIQYEFIESISSEEFERRITSKQMNKLKNRVTDKELQEILGCLKSMKDDIPQEAFELIF